MAFKDLVGKAVTKEVTFMGEKVQIRKLTVAQVLEIQAKAKELEGSEEGNLDVLILILTLAVPGASEISKEDFQNFPMDELAKLSNDVMRHSGVAGDAGK